jgi:hypothetical protein
MYHQRHALRPARVTIWLIVLIVSVFMPCRAEDIFADLPDELITLRDGRQLPGRYHAEQGVLRIAGIGHASIRVSEQMIVKRQPLISPSKLSTSGDQIKALKSKSLPMVEVSQQEEPATKEKIIIQYQPPMALSSDAAALELTKEKIADQRARINYLERLYTTEVEYSGRLVERVRKLTDHYKAARDYFEKHGQAYLGYENGASYQFREAMRLLSIGQNDLDTSLNKASDNLIKKQDAEQVMATMLEEQRRLEQQLLREKEHHLREQSNMIKQ